MKRLCLLGIDGSGKTTLMRRLQQTAGDQVSFLFSPDFHEIPGFEGAEESRALTQFSQLADSWADPSLKLASLYLRMCLFGEAEKFLTATQPRPTLCIERHALIDSLLYLPILVGAVRRAGARLGDTAQVMERIAQTHPGVARHVLAALARRNRRMELGEVPIERVAEYCAPFVTLAPADFVKSVARDFQTTLPNLVLYLDIGPERALERIRQRGKAVEGHESLESLTRLDQLAKSKLADFEKLGVACEVLPVSSLTGPELEQVVSRHFEVDRF